GSTFFPYTTLFRSTGSPRVADQAERLEGLAETHVVGEDAAEVELPQVHEPAYALQLVVTRSGGDTAEIDLGQGLMVDQRSRGVHPASGLSIDDAECGELLPNAEVEVGDPQAVVVVLLQLGGGSDQLGEPGELRPVGGDIEPAG